MMGCAINILIISVARLWGPFAMPREEPSVIIMQKYARGTTATCNISGFLQHLKYVLPCYYFALSFLCYCSIRAKFRDIQKHAWVEKWIHLCVYLYPVVSGCYLWVIEAFNPAAFYCSVVSIPVGCGCQADESEAECCTRGPQDPSRVLWLFVALPSFVIMFLTTAQLLIVYLHARCQNYEKVAVSIARQSAIFLVLAIYWSYLFTAIYTRQIHKKEEYSFVIDLLHLVISSLQGLWNFLVYWYFKSKQPNILSEESRRSVEIIVVDKNEEPKQDGAMDPSSNAANVSSSISLSALRPEFSIFDGSNLIDSNSPWAEFLNDQGEDSEFINRSSVRCFEWSTNHFSAETSGDVLESSAQLSRCISEDEHSSETTLSC